MIRLVRRSILWFLLAVYVNQSFVLTSDFAKVPAGLSQSLLESAFTGVCPALDVTAITASLIITAIHIYIRFAEFRCFPTVTLDMKTFRHISNESVITCMICSVFCWDGALRQQPRGIGENLRGAYLSQPSELTEVKTVKLCEHNRGWVETWKDDDLITDDLLSSDGDITPPPNHVFFSAKIILAVFFSDYVFNWWERSVINASNPDTDTVDGQNFNLNQLIEQTGVYHEDSPMSQRFVVTEFNCLRKNAVYFYVRRVLGIFVWQILNPPTGSDTKENIVQWDSSCRVVFWGGVRTV